jgi:hypothetical protein
MSKGKGTRATTEAELRAVPLPEKTKTYTVIPHGEVIDRVKSDLEKNGFEILECEYSEQTEGQIALGKVYIKSDRDPDMGMLFTWQNSYNKRVKFLCAVGGFIYDNIPSLLGSEDMSWERMHTGTADVEAWTVTEQLIEGASDFFDKIITEKETMKSMDLSVEDYGCIMGALYFEHSLITSTQASAVKNERNKPEHTYTDEDTLWGLYKVLMYGIDGMDITKWVKSQQKLHHMIMAEYAIAQAEGIDTIKIHIESDEHYADRVVAENKGEGDDSYTEASTPFSSDVDLPLSTLSDDLPKIEPAEDFTWNTEGDGEIQLNAGATSIEDSHSMTTQTEMTVAEATEMFPESADEIKKAVEQGDGSSNTDFDTPSVESHRIVTLDLSEGEDPADNSIQGRLAQANGDFEEPADWSTPAAEPEAEAVVEIPAAKMTEEEIEVVVEEHGGEAKSGILEEVPGDPALNDFIQETVEFEAEVENDFAGVTPVVIPEEPVEIIPPTINLPEVKEVTKEVKTVVEEPAEDFLAVEAHEGLEVPAELIQQAAIIEKRMIHLYGGVSTYTHMEVDGYTVVTLDVTLETFCIAN